MTSVLADSVVLLHMCFVVFVVAGGLLALRWRRMAWVHVPCAVTITKKGVRVTRPF